MIRACVTGLLASETEESGVMYGTYLDREGKETHRKQYFDQETKQWVQNQVIVTPEQALAKRAIEIADAVLAEVDAQSLKGGTNG